MRIEINREEFVSECKFRTSRSGGKGGQNVNKVETKVELLFDVSLSALLTDEQKDTLYQKLKTYIASNVLQISSSEYRSQWRNKQHSINKAIDLIESALIPQKERKPTKQSKQSKERRLNDKRINALKKEYRRRMF